MLTMVMSLSFEYIGSYTIPNKCAHTVFIIHIKQFKCSSHFILEPSAHSPSLIIRKRSRQGHTVRPLRTDVGDLGTEAHREPRSQCGAHSFQVEVPTHSEGSTPPPPGHPQGLPSSTSQSLDRRPPIFSGSGDPQGRELWSQRRGQYKKKCVFNTEEVMNYGGCHVLDLLLISEKFV